MNVSSSIHKRHTRPNFAEAAAMNFIRKRIDTKFKAMETHFKLILRDVLKDTLLALRDAMRVNSASLEKNIDDASREIISEMPRGLFGRLQKK
jgi:hypothetical protein